MENRVYCLYRVSTDKQCANSFVRNFFGRKGGKKHLLYPLNDLLVLLGRKRDRHLMT